MQLAFHTLNSSRSAYQSITFKPDFFDVYNITGDLVQCSVLLKVMCYFYLNYNVHQASVVPYHAVLTDLVCAGCLCCS